ncbi:hypothetical protein HGRIS_009161 [Hohenbuehelia grisea]|uniref:UAA transporter n=1 Tax=Hohenbuehelia grisea TaxID=104357 RepID=A0ABR3J0N3_9AGAR
MSWTLMSTWAPTLSLVFGGCCSNAVTLQRLTTDHPRLGTLITFSQFALISLHGLPKHTEWTSRGPRLKPRKIPIAVYFIQVMLFYLVSLLNNAAFGYHIPMSVHIIFRSGGLMVSMLLGWLVAGKRYSFIQVTSVILVTLGVTLTTMSAAQAPTEAPESTSGLGTYYTGIAILSLALVLSGFLGLAQDWTWSHYGRPAPASSQQDGVHTKSPRKLQDDPSPAWQESMFYLHFLALPMFIPVLGKIAAEAAAIYPAKSVQQPFPKSSLIRVPTAFIPLILNTVTQLFCVAGVNRLTTQVSALTVTLVLVVRKAASLIISVVFMESGDIDADLMWTGAIFVLAGTVGYSVGSGGRKTKRE